MTHYFPFTDVALATKPGSLPQCNGQLVDASSYSRSLETNCLDAPNSFRDDVVSATIDTAVPTTAVAAAAAAVATSRGRFGGYMIAQPDSQIPDFEEFLPCSGGSADSWARYPRVIHSPCLQMDGLRYERFESRLDPYSPLCMVPLPDHLHEPTFIRRRNERERERVRCVNEGYDRLKKHLPLENKDRRISKVETLRGAIRYIRYLKCLLDEESGKDAKTKGVKSANKNGEKSSNGVANNIFNFSSDGDVHTDLETYVFDDPARHRRRHCSLTSDDSQSPASST